MGCTAFSSKKAGRSRAPPLRYYCTAARIRRHTQVPPYEQVRHPLRRGGRLCPPPLYGSHSRRAGPMCPASPRIVYRYARLNGTRQRQPIVGAGLCSALTHRCPASLRRGGGLVAGARVSPSAHSSQGVAGAAPPAPIGASTSVGRDDPGPPRPVASPSEGGCVVRGASHTVGAVHEWPAFAPPSAAGGS